MSNTPTRGIGTTFSAFVASSALALSTATGATKTAIGNLTKITPPKPKVDGIDTTSLDTTNRVKTSIPGLIDPGEMEIEGQMIYGQGSSEASNQSILYAALFAGTIGSFEVGLVNGATLDFNGYLTGFEIGEASIDNIITFKATIKVTNSSTFTPHS
jgi:Lambda phage tail tube protein, TTP